MVEIVEATLNGKWKMRLPKHRAERPNWYTEQGWEKPRLQVLHDIIKKQDKSVVFYVGAEEGEMPALCQMWGADIVLFEPNDRVWSNIFTIWEANNLESPLSIFSGFAGNENKDVERGRYAAGVWPDSAKLPVIHDHGFKELQANDITHLPVVKIDDYGIIPTIITMDVEGAEFEVLKGAEQTLINHRPVIVLSLHPEFLHAYWGVHSRDVRNWIIGKRYTETLLDYEHEVHLLYEPK